MYRDLKTLTIELVFNYEYERELEEIKEIVKQFIELKTLKEIKYNQEQVK